MAKNARAQRAERDRRAASALRKQAEHAKQEADQRRLILLQQLNALVPRVRLQEKSSSASEMSKPRSCSLAVALV